MKVTVCFGETRVIVPCGDGELTVLELTSRAISRYKKTKNKDHQLDVVVHCLKTNEELAILDIDDLVSDVCDDKDKLIAVYEESARNGLQSASRNSDVVPGHYGLSLIEQNNNLSKNGEVEDSQHFVMSALSDNDSGVAADSWNGMSSHPASAHASFNSSRPPRGIQRRFPQSKNASFRSSASSASPASSPELSRRNELLASFKRDLNRKSLSTNHPMLYSWIDQQDRMFNENRFFRDYNYGTAQADSLQPSADVDEESEKSAGSEELELDTRSVGSVTIKPYTTSDGREVGLVVHGVADGAYVDGVGELQTADRITEINGVSLRNMTNDEAVDLFESAKRLDVMKLKRTRSHHFLRDRADVLLPKAPLKSSPLVASQGFISTSKEAPKPALTDVDSEPKEVAIEAPKESLPDVNHGNKKYFTVELEKGTNGLGFSVTSKDVLTSSTREFFVKNILPKGAAIQDGRIQPGDQLITVNGVDLRNKSQQDVVVLLRSASGVVVLYLSRDKDDGITSPEPPASDSQASENMLSGSESISPLPEEILSLTIIFASQGTAGLGISVKGKKREGCDLEDRGIYVKSIIAGGAAAKDGRLRANDQLLCINGTSIIGLQNSEAMEVLRACMQGSLQAGKIDLIIGRSKQSSRSSSRASSPCRRDQMLSPDQPMASPRQSEHEAKADRSISMEDAEKQPNDAGLNGDSVNRSLSHAISRNRSYFRAVDRRQVRTSDSDGEDARDQTPSLPPAYDQRVDQESSLSPRHVVTVSAKIPTLQKSRPIFISPHENGMLTADLSRADAVESLVPVKKAGLPSYEEALKRRDTSSSTSSRSSKADAMTPTGSAKGEMRFRLLPDKLFAVPPEEKLKQEQSIAKSTAGRLTLRQSLSLDETGSGSGNSEKRSGCLSPDGERCMSVASQSSLDSVMQGPSSMPFSRDAFGRSSISEKKGRGQLDATKSNFYNKMKKYKSMEELRALHQKEDRERDVLDDNNQTPLPRTESVDTLISKMDIEESRDSAIFNRGTLYSSSTPWFSPTEERKKLRGRNIALNDSFRTALEQLDDQESAGSSASNVAESPGTEKKRKGFLKGISDLLKRGRKPKQHEVGLRDRSAEPRLMSPPTQDEVLLRREPGSGQVSRHRPLSLSDETLSTKGTTPIKARSDQELKYNKIDQVQKELVQARLAEMQRERKEQKRKQKHAVPDKESDSHAFNEPQASVYLTWDAHSPAHVREKTREMFYGSKDGPRSSVRLQRQSSLPPRAKKNSVEDAKQTLPRAPSGPLPAARKQQLQVERLRSDTDPSRYAEPSVDSAKDPQSTPQRSLEPVVSRSEMSKPQTHAAGSSHDSAVTIGKPSNGVTTTKIGQITRHRPSISVSHKAEI